MVARDTDQQDLVAKDKRDELIAILLDGTQRMTGCLSYIVAGDTTDADRIWITEVLVHVAGSLRDHAGGALARLQALWEWWRQDRHARQLSRKDLGRFA